MEGPVTENACRPKTRRVPGKNLISSCAERGVAFRELQGVAIEDK